MWSLPKVLLLTEMKSNTQGLYLYNVSQQGLGLFFYSAYINQNFTKLEK